MAFVEIEPKYRELLERQGSTGPDELQGLPGVVICGHPDRHVAQVTLGSGPDAVAAFLKREHRVPWRDRLANALAGFGFVSKSYREALLLRLLRRAGVGCPELIAAGSDARGRAFLLVRQAVGAVDLRLFLKNRLPADPDRRRLFARRLGESLARVHAAGFDHPDLYSKHILVNPEDETICILDWQRSRRWRRLGLARRCRDLAALDATLADDLATPRERFECLRAYLRRSPGLAASLGRARSSALAPGSRLNGRSLRLPVRRFAHQLRRLSQRLLGRRRIRELHQPPLACGDQNLIWLDGEALCVTRAFQDDCLGTMPAWLKVTGHKPRNSDQLVRTPVVLPGGRPATLVRRWANRPLAWLWSRLRRKPLTSPEVRQAGIQFRLQRYGVESPRLLAVGEQHSFLGRTESFLLSEAVPGAVGLAAWLADHPGGPVWTAEHKQRRRVIRQAAVLLRRMHEANCYFVTAPASCPLAVRSGPGDRLTVVLDSLEGLGTRHRPSQTLALRDLERLRKHLGGAGCGHAEERQFLLAYLAAAPVREWRAGGVPAGRLASAARA
jgi:tRNA A-37 threonylcarbamoyl transferase component Bud32